MKSKSDPSKLVLWKEPVNGGFWSFSEKRAFSYFFEKNARFASHDREKRTILIPFSNTNYSHQNSLKDIESKIEKLAEHAGGRSSGKLRFYVVPRKDAKT